MCFCPIFKLQNVMYETQTSEKWSRMLKDEGTITVIQKSSGILTGVPFMHKTAWLLSKQFLGLLPKSLYHNFLQITVLCKFEGFLHLSIYKPKLCAGFILVINQLHAQNLFFNKFISCLYMFWAPCAHRQEVIIVLYSLWYHHTYRWPSGAQVERGLNLCMGQPPIGVMIPETV